MKIKFSTNFLKLVDEVLFKPYYTDPNINSGIQEELKSLGEIEEFTRDKNYTNQKPKSALTNQE